MSAPSAWLLVSGVGMMLVGIVAVLSVTRKSSTLWRATAWGAAGWVVAVVLKFAWALPMNSLVHRRLVTIAGTAAGEPLFWAYVGLLTGVFECGITALVVARTRLRSGDWRDALAFGTGFGGMEAFALGVVGFLGIAAVVLAYDVLPADLRTKLATALAGRAAPLPLALPVLERINTLFVHAFSCVAVVYGFRTRRALRWFAVAFVYKSAVDGVAIWTITALKARESIPGLARSELILAFFGVVGLVGLVYLRKRMATAAVTV